MDESDAGRLEGEDQSDSDDSVQIIAEILSSSSNNLISPTFVSIEDFGDIEMMDENQEDTLSNDNPFNIVKTEPSEIADLFSLDINMPITIKIESPDEELNTTAAISNDDMIPNLPLMKGGPTKIKIEKMDMSNSSQAQAMGIFLDIPPIPPINNIIKIKIEKEKCQVQSQNQNRSNVLNFGHLDNDPLFHQPLPTKEYIIKSEPIDDDFQNDILIEAMPIFQLHKNKLNDKEKKLKIKNLIQAASSSKSNSSAEEAQRPIEDNMSMAMENKSSESEIEESQESETEEQLLFDTAPKCEVCEEKALVRCFNCKKAYFCSDLHYREYYKEHKKRCLPYLRPLTFAGEKANYIAANRKIEEGSLIMTSFSTLAIHEIMNKKRTQFPCLGCESINGSHKCKVCNFPLCSEECQNSYYHQKFECEYMQVKEMRAPDNLLEMYGGCYTNFLLDLAVLRMIICKNRKTEIYDQFVDIIENNKDFEKFKSKWNGHLIKNIDKWWQYSRLFDSDPTLAENYATMALAFYFNFKRESNRKINTFFPQLAWVRHSCYPNTTISIARIDQCYEIKLIAAKDFAKGEIITVDKWGLEYLPTNLRQSFLKQHFIKCSCIRCAKNSEDYTKLNSIVCVRCWKYLMNPVFNEDKSKFIMWNCESKAKCTAKHIPIVLDRTRDAIEDLEKLTNEEMGKINCSNIEAFIEEWDPHLPKTNYIMATLRRRLLDQLFNEFCEHADDDDLDSDLFTKIREIKEKYPTTTYFLHSKFAPEIMYFHYIEVVSEATEAFSKYYPRKVVWLENKLIIWRDRLKQAMKILDLYEFNEYNRHYDALNYYRCFLKDLLKQIKERKENLTPEELAASSINEDFEPSTRRRPENDDEANVDRVLSTQLFKLIDLLELDLRRR